MSRKVLENAGVLTPAGEVLADKLIPEKFPLIEEAFEKEPEDPLLRSAYLTALVKLGASLHNQGQHAKAIILFRKGLAFAPDSPVMLYYLGCSLHDAGQQTEAMEVWEKTVRQHPDFVEPVIAMGNALCAQQRFAEARRYLRQALSLAPDNAEALHLLAVSLHQEGNCKEARSYYERAIGLSPESAVMRANFGKLLLLLGDLPAGFRENEWRVKKPDIRKYYFHGVLAKPAWQGEIFSGKQLLVHKEQGLGDIIQFVRYLPMVKERGGTVAFSSPPELMGLFSRLTGVDVLVEHTTAALGNLVFDLVVPLLSLPHIFGTTLKTVPSPVPYTTADPALAARWRSSLPVADGKMRIGLVWAAKMTDEHSRKRSCGLAALKPLLSVPGTSFFSLQKGEGAKQLRGCASPITDLTEGLHDFAETAALIASLDLVITVDTSVAHLAGAMGKPTWVLQTYLPDWRWMLAREDSPWYPTVRLFRQPEPGDWESVAAQAAAALAELVG
jgi:Flp pilus assembly protein TadD